MILIHILSYFLDIENSDIPNFFDVALWNQNNPDFYVPPHPILYLLTFNVPYFIIIRYVLLFLVTTYLSFNVYNCLFTFFTNYYFSTVNLIFPATISHLFYIGFMAISLVFDFISGILFAEKFGNFWIIIFLAIDFIMKWFDWKAIVKILTTTHVILTDNNVYYWILNYFSFGILGTWPLVRPDYFQNIEEFYCSYWSC